MSRVSGVILSILYKQLGQYLPEAKACDLGGMNPEVLAINFQAHS